MSKYKKITSIAMLKQECADKHEDFFIHFGALRSSKSILFNTGTQNFEIFNSIDGTDQVLEAKELFTESNIGKAVHAGNFYMDVFTPIGEKFNINKDD